ncbi:glucosyltransferase domain-containing protein [Bifidobacterium stellenboschense]|uniref:Glucosyl transferase GtrII n=1 Tax=Bifidobacterium stellenboschense TaxID=762211 RepID=A0A087DN07_9BIFI|nr:glucosyltransferase domain-containing protein [Bifidobacterium stellenboschense]KFI96907.1 glucosyl transferase GtrII [Bifidobacterium stellenboschense]
MAASAEISPTKYQYSITGFLRFIKEYVGQITISMFFLLLAFGQKLFSNTFSIDTQALINNREALYTSWFELERFGLVVTKKIFGVYQYNNALASFTMVTFFGISAIIWAYLICRPDNSRTLQPAFFIIPYVASPIFAEMLGFLLLGPEISVASTLIAVALMQWSNALSATGRKEIALLAIGAIICTVVSFTMYLAMVTFFITGTAILFVLNYSNKEHVKKTKRESLTFLAGSILIFAISYVSYKLLNSLAMHIKGVTTNAYITDQSHWGKDSLRTIIHNIGRHAIELYSGNGIFYSALFTFTTIVVLIAAVILVVNKRITIFAGVVSFLIALSPMIMSFVLGGNPSVRTEMTYPLAFSFATVMAISGVEKVKLPILNQLSINARKTLAWVLIIAIGWNQALITSRIFYTENVVFTQDVLTAQEIKTRIDALGLGEHPNEPVVFVGNHTAKCNSDCYPTSQLGLTGRSMLEIGFSTAHGTGVKTQFMNDVLGVSYNGATETQIKKSEINATTMPHWPNPGSVAKKDGVIIVNF